MCWSLLIGTSVYLPIYATIQSFNYMAAAHICIKPCRHKSIASVNGHNKHQNGKNMISVTLTVAWRFFAKSAGLSIQETAANFTYINV